MKKLFLLAVCAMVQMVNLNAQTIEDKELSLSGHIDFLKPGPNEVIKIDKNVRANYVLKLFIDPSDKSRPQRKTAVLYCDVDFKALGSDHDIPIDWSWSGKNVNIASHVENGNKVYAIMDGNNVVATILPDFKVDGNQGTVIMLQGGGEQLAGLRPGMHIDEMARQIQSDLPGTRVVVTGNKKDGLSEYVLLWFGENKVYDVTGDYHYELTADEPYFTFWIDSNNKLVKWFKLKNHGIR